MSFATPLALIGLLAIPALLACYLLSQRHRGRAAEALSSSWLVASIAPERPGWRRHAAPLAYLGAILLVLLACAGPRVTVDAAVQRLQTMLAIDVSGSMAATDVSPNRVTAAQHAADVLVTQVPAQVGIGVMQFNQAPQVLVRPTKNRTSVFEALGRLRVSGGTAIGNAIQTALGILDPRATARPGTVSGVIVLVSDGKSTSGVNTLQAARRAKQLHVPIFTIALGTPNGTISVPRAHGTGSVEIHVPPDPSALAQIARASGGRSYTAADAGHLSSIYSSIGKDISHRREHRDLTTLVLAAGLALGLVGAALSLVWFGRLV